MHDNLLPRGYLRACLLLLVAEAPAHGYDLVARARDLGVTDGNAGGLYRALRGLESDGLVESWWALAPAGPPRRLYRLTDAGASCLGKTGAALMETHEHLAAYLDRHRALERRGPHAGARPAALALVSSAG